MAEPTYIPLTFSSSKSKAPRRGRAIRPDTDEDVELYLREFRAGVMRDELRAYQGMRDRGEVSMSDREITDSANRIADDVMRSKGLPSGEELQEWRIQREAEDDISSRSDKPYWFLNPAAIDRAATRVIAGTASTQAKVADFATAPIQAALGRSDKDYFSGTASDARNLLDLQSRAASEESSGIGEDLLTGLVQFAGDPAFVGAYTKTRAALRAANAARGQNAVRATRLNASDDIIAGGVGDLLASGIRSDFDPEQMKEEFGLGLIGGVAMEGVSRGIGAAWKKAFPGKPLPRSKSEAEQALDAYDPEWRNKPLDPDSPMGQLQAATKDLQDEVDNVRIIEAEKQAAKYDPGERIETPEQGAKKGIDRFNDRQAARDEKLQEGLDAPHIAKDKAKRGVVDRLEAENQGGKVLDFEAEQARIQEDVRAEALKDPDTFELVNELQAGGMSRAQAEAIAIPELDTPAPTVSGAGNSMVGETPARLPDDPPVPVNIKKRIDLAFEGGEVRPSGASLEAQTTAIVGSLSPTIKNPEGVWRSAQRYVAEKLDKMTSPTRPVEGASGEQLQMFRSGIAPDDIAAMVSDAIAAGKWTAKQAIVGARWALEVGGDAIKTMRDFAGVMLDKFGRGIRKHIPEMWQKFKAMRQRVAATRERTRLARQKGGIDLRGSKQSPDQTRNFAKDSIIARVKRRVSKETFDQLVDPIADRLYKASPRIYNRMYRFMTEANIAKHELRSVMDPIMHDPLIKKLPEYNQNEIKSALLNADPKNLDEVLGKISPESASKVREMVENARFILNDLFDEAKAVGMEPGYLENFWPRLIKPGKTKLLREKLSGGQKSEFDDALKEVALNKYGGDVSRIPENEVASVMSRVLSGYGPRPLDSSLPKPLKQRSVSKIPDEYLQYYESFDKSLDAYIERMTNEIAKRRLLGGNKSLDLDNAEVLADSVAKLIRDEGITGAKADDVASMIQSVIRGSEAPVGSVTRVMRDTGYILTMGQFKSAIRQLGDFSVSANQYGVANTLKGAYRTVLGKNRVSLLDIGLDRIAEEFSGARSSRAVDLTFKATGLDLLDRKIIKNTVLEAALLKAQKQAQRNPEALKKQLAKEFGEDADKLVEALAKGDTSSDELAVYLTSRLGDVQPVTRLEVPQGYLDGRAQSGFKGLRGWPVLAYQLKTFTLRRLGLIRRQGIHEIAEGLRMMKAGEGGGVQRVLKGSRTIMGMVAMFTAADASVDQLINWVYGEDDTLGESAADAALSLVGTNRYGVDQSRRSGSAGAATMFMPASLSTLYQALVTDPARIIEGKEPKTLDRIPHMQTLKRFIESGDSGGNSPAPPKPPSPPSPPRP